ncbi:MAG TPA: DUF1616 domain-containing protein [Herpetosiphonaceae bacterium]
MIMKQTVATPVSEPMRQPVSTWIFYDLIALMSCALLLPLLVVLPLPLLRVPLGLVLVLFAPGYALSAALFARHHDLDSVTRLSLSVGLSIAALPLLALALDLLPWGIRLWPMTIALAAWIGAWSLIAAIRRSLLLRSQAAMQPTPPIAVQGWWHELSPHRRLSYAGSALAGAALLLWVVVGLPALTASRPTTEFYMLGPEGLAQDYPHAAIVGAEMQVPLGIHNHEGRSVTYRVEARSGTQQLARIDEIEVAAGAIWEHPLRYLPAQAGDDQRIDILLFRANESVPYRQLHLWIDAQEPLR